MAGRAVDETGLPDAVIDGSIVGASRGVDGVVAEVAEDRSVRHRLPLAVPTGASAAPARTARAEPRLRTGRPAGRLATGTGPMAVVADQRDSDRGDERGTLADFDASFASEASGTITLPLDGESE